MRDFPAETCFRGNSYSSALYWNTCIRHMQDHALILYEPVDSLAYMFCRATGFSPGQIVIAEWHGMQRRPGSSRRVPVRRSL
ncbi:MAG TPA: hypothetical protein VLX12_08115, partial [Syntrophorhabdales bacterium]|nr:hypothetical protein [Syntrophorhabdales bacterium]